MQAVYSMPPLAGKLMVRRNPPVLLPLNAYIKNGASRAIYAPGPDGGHVAGLSGPSCTPPYLRKNAGPMPPDDPHTLRGIAPFLAARPWYGWSMPVGLA